MAFVPEHAAPRPEKPVEPLKIMMFPLGFLLAHVGRLMQIGEVLRDRGHEVIFAGDWPRHHRSRLDMAAKAGFDVVPMKEPDHPYAWDRFQKYGWPITGWDLFRLGKWSPLDEILSDQLNLIDEHRPDIMVCDASSTTSTASYISGVPAVGVMNGYAVPLISPGSFFHPIIHLWDFVVMARMRKRVYDRYGIKPMNAFDLVREMPMLSPDLEGIYDIPEWWQNFEMVGPIYSEPDVPMPEWYGELDDGTPNVYITMGSTGWLDQFLRQVYPTFATLPYRFLVTTAGQVTRETELRAPDNFRIARYAPGSRLLEKSQAMIFHGGNGSLYQALAAGVPMLALPSHLEQELCADMAVNHGFGLKLAAKNGSGENTAALLDRLINEPSFRESAERFGGRVRHADGAQRAADIIEAKARKHQRTAATA